MKTSLLDLIARDLSSVLIVTHSLLIDDLKPELSAHLLLIKIFTKSCENYKSDLTFINKRHAERN